MVTYAKGLFVVALVVVCGFVFQGATEATADHKAWNLTAHKVQIDAEAMRYCASHPVETKDVHGALLQAISEGSTHGRFRYWWDSASDLEAFAVQ